MSVQRSVKVVVVGDGAVGKTSMLMSFVEGRMPEEYVPTVFENHAVSQKIEQTGEVITMNLWDTAGQEAYDRLRTISYSDCNLFLLCFSIASPISFDNIEQKWHPELRHYSAAPILLVGTKSDLRGDAKVVAGLAKKKLEPITFAQGVALSKQLGAVSYLECSALSQDGLREVFSTAAKEALEQTDRERGVAAGGSSGGGGGKGLFGKCALL